MHIRIVTAIGLLFEVEGLTDTANCCDVEYFLTGEVHKLFNVDLQAFVSNIKIMYIGHSHQLGSIPV